METLIYTKNIEEKLKLKVWTVDNGVFIKRRKGNAYLETLRIIDRNLDRLTLDYFSIYKYLYVSEVDKSVKAFGSTYYSNYQDLKDVYLSNEVNKKQIFNEAIEAIFELESIGVNYTDIHARNIIVADSHIRLVDLDEATPLTFKDPKTCLILDLILESFLFNDINDGTWEYIEPRYTLRALDSKNVLSYSLVNSLNGGMSESAFLSKVDSYLDELMDEEKVKVIKKELRLKHPEFYAA